MMARKEADERRRDAVMPALLQKPDQARRLHWITKALHAPCARPGGALRWIAVRLVHAQGFMTFQATFHPTFIQKKDSS
jgi:hypothetical protein